MKKKKTIIVAKWGALLGAGLSLIKLLGFFAEKLEYPFGPVSDLLMVVAIVACLYLAIRDVRDKLQDGLIKFSRAFLIGAGVVVIGYIVLSFYMFLHFGVIDKEGIAKINQKNINHAVQVVKKENVTDEELKTYREDLRDAALRESALLADDTLRHRADSGVVVILKLFNRSLDLRLKDDSTILRRDTFDLCADKLLHETTTFVRMNQPEISPLSCDAVEAARDTLVENPIWQKRLDGMKDRIPQYHTILAGATITTFAVLLYGIMLAIFVALFLYRKTTTVCERNDNDPALADDDTSAETHEETASEQNEENTPQP